MKMRDWWIWIPAKWLWEIIPKADTQQGRWIQSLVFFAAYCAGMLSLVVGLLWIISVVL